MDGTVFVYGSLMAEEVVQVLLRRQPERRPATLHGYRRHRIQKRVYPAIIPATPADSVQGWVLLGLDQREMHILDEYEDVDYYRTTEHPVFEDGSSVAACVYVWVEQLRHLLYGDWDYQEFRNGPQFQPYVQMSREFLEEYEREGAVPAENGPKSVG